MSKLITRWDAVEVVYKALRIPAPDYKKDPFHDSYSLAISMVREIPSAQQWIPVSERLPDDEQRVLLSSRYGVELITWDEDSKRLYRECRNLVVAWMPLPEPYCGAEMGVTE